MSKRWERLPRVLDEEEAERFFDGFRTRYWTPARDQLAFRIMYEAGLRVSETLSLQPDHIESTPTGGIITVRDGKNGVDRKVGVGHDLLEAINEWAERRHEKAPDSPWLFPTRSGERVEPRHMLRTCKRIAERVDLREAERLTNHDFRHTFAVQALLDGVNIEDLRKALGHTHLSHTQRYITLAEGSHVEALQERANGKAHHDESSDSEDPDDVWSDLDEEEKKALLSIAEKVKGEG